MSEQAQPIDQGTSTEMAGRVPPTNTTQDWFLASFFLMLGLFLFLPERGMAQLNSFVGLGPNGLKYYAIVVLFTLPTIIVWNKCGFANAARLLGKMLLLALITMSLAIGLHIALQSVFPSLNIFISMAVAALPATVLVIGFARWMQVDMSVPSAKQA